MKHPRHAKQDPQGAQRENRAPEHSADTNHGEGNPEAAAHFNTAEQEFVASKRGQQKIGEAGNVRPEEEAALQEAERITRSPPIDSTPKVTPPKEGRR
jgi:hypothetical protein